MLTDTELRNLQPRTKPYKITDRDGMYVVVSPAGTVSFRYDYRINGRRETLTIGRYGRDGISLANARERLSDSRRAVRQGRSPTIEKQREKRRLARAKTFGEFAAQWLKDARMADTTRSMRKSILERDIKPVFESRMLCEISADDLRALCQRIKGRGAPATAAHVRDIVKQIYAFANLHGEKTCAAGSRYVLPSRYDPDRCMSQATLNRVTQLIVERAKAAGLSLAPFTVHDLRRTGSTLLNEAGFNGEWIEKCLAHEEERSSRSVYNKAEFAEQRRHMLQEWANMIDAWTDGET
jgi:integrase